MLSEFRCKCCKRLLAKVDGSGKIEIKCPKCKSMNLYQDETIVERIIERGVIEFDFLKN